jgi:hypothetical protein
MVCCAQPALYALLYSSAARRCKQEARGAAVSASLYILAAAAWCSSTCSATCHWHATLPPTLAVCTADDLLAARAVLRCPCTLLQELQLVPCCTPSPLLFLQCWLQLHHSLSAMHALSAHCCAALLLPCGVAAHADCAHSSLRHEHLARQHMCQHDVPLHDGMHVSAGVHLTAHQHCSFLQFIITLLQSGGCY